ncbi:DUF6281 family protein [Streptomyces sp. NPDC048425]|uniref:DUF6281 family protein n=1 Tax=Streptomyces sp. NPDC048425 TaxID=3365548 RepID=UPI00371D8027
MALVMLSTAVACGSDGNQAESEGVCARAFTYGDRTYTSVANVEFRVGSKLGTATPPPCDDTGGQKDGTPLEAENAYAVKGISSKIAIAVGETPEEAVFAAVHSGKALPPEVRKLIDQS